MTTAAATTITNIRKHVLIAIGALTLGATALSAQAQAQQAPAGAAATEQAQAGRHAHAANREARAARFQERVAKRQAALHDKLKITAAQEPAWAAFTAAVTPQRAAGQFERARVDRTAMAKLSAPERAEKRLDWSKQRLARQESRVAALKTLYATLTPEQQQTFDELGARHGKRGHGPMRRG